MQERTITLTTDDGKEVVCDILFTYHSDEFNKDYVVFQPRGTEEASAACYIEHENGEGELVQIQTDEEWEMLEDLLEDYSNQLEENSGCSGGCASCGGGCGSDDCDCNCA
ncbi:MAG TPA: DUF1292 domain-containing protein [Candidatus Pelethenecus faecipullorum]|uniref:DUF1292 domain-containing protein n=1 Tax=Candidatus Pelethenecus faecipullorum TaxID=2840900 RepID=A0A9D1GR23_9MOLU|nr:DUF1292 domain-containing protein [Candidatus Pelethenecus faecipullorum]